MRLQSLLIAATLCSVTCSSVQADADRFGVTYVPGSASHAQIEKAPNQAEGMAWITYFHKPGYGALIARRTKPGRAEVHTALTDVWYVIDGSGTLVTGGRLVDGKTTEKGEIRGRAIDGGVVRRIGKGDLIDIPAGVPHWVSKIDGEELVYLTVKVATPAR